MMLLCPLPTPTPMPTAPSEQTSAALAPQGRSRDREPCVEADVVPLARASRPDPSSDVAIEDWDILLGAVKARLRQTVGECPVAASRARRDDEAGRVQASVLECVAALDQLHATLTHELDRCVRQRTDSFSRPI